MPYDRFGYPIPTSKDNTRKTSRTLIALAVLVLVVVLFRVFGRRDGKEADSDTEEAAVLIRHDSLAPSYTYNGETIRWYVFIDPDTNVQYLFNDRGGCCVREGMDEG